MINAERQFYFSEHATGVIEKLTELSRYHPAKTSDEVERM